VARISGAYRWFSDRYKALAADIAAMQTRITQLFGDAALARLDTWAFCYAKQKNVPAAKKAPEGAGDIWTWVGLDANTKLVASFYVGDRDSEAAEIFINDLAKRLANRVQLTSDGHRPYLEAIEGAFVADIDYAMLVKVYGAAPEGQHRYSPAVCTGAHKHRIEGHPDPKHVSTSFVERQNLSMRMGNRRMTRLTNAFSKKAENHAHMMAIYFMHYNFVRIHQTLKVTPAMAAGVTSKLWEMSDMIGVLEAWELGCSLRISHNSHPKKDEPHDEPNHD
jgi:IS1 family transposase